MISDEALPAIRLQFRAPFLKLRVDRILELLLVRLVSRGMRRIERGQSSSDVLGDGFGDDRVDHEMRIPHRMDVAGRAA